MIIKLRNWKLALLALIFFCLFISLGIWQINRANYKKLLLKTYAERTVHTPYKASELATPNDWRYYRATLVGKYDNEHTFLLDNKTHKGQVGYEVYTPFKADGLDEIILVDRGFAPMDPDRSKLPKLKNVGGEVTLTGMLNLPPIYVSLGQLADAKQVTWPLRIEFISLTEMGKIANLHIFPYILNLQPNDPGALDIEWQIVTTDPERNMGYAVQWFALAITLLILFAVLNWRKIDGANGTSPRRQSQKLDKTGTSSKRKK